MGSPSPNEVIVVVEDEDGVRDVFARTLRTLGYTVLEFVGMLRAAHPELPALFVSGQSAQWMMDNRDRVPERTHFVAKPITIAGLANKVRQILDEGSPAG